MPADGNRDYLHVEANHQVVLRTRFHPFHTHFATDRPNHFLHRPIGHLGYANPLSTGEGKAGHYSNRYRRSHQFHPELSADSPVLSVWCGHLHFDCRIVRSRRNNSDREEISPYPVHKQAKPTIFPGYSPDNGFSLSINHLRLDDYLKLLIGIPVSVVFYCLYLYGRKDAFALQIKNILVSKLKSHI